MTEVAGIGVEADLKRRSREPGRQFAQAAATAPEPQRQQNRRVLVVKERGNLHPTPPVWRCYGLAFMMISARSHGEIRLHSRSSPFAIAFMSGIVNFLGHLVDPSIERLV